MDIISDIKKEARYLIYGNRLDQAEMTGKESAELLGKSLSYLSKICSLNEPFPTPLEVILPLMLKRKRYRLLELLCWKCGGVFVKLPKAGNKKQDDLDTSEEFHAAAADAVAALGKALKTPTDDNLKAALEALKKCTAESVSAHKYVEEKATKQIRMEL
jgi:hypothetical protein